MKCTVAKKGDYARSKSKKINALRRSRTGDLVITSDALYQLSYQGGNDEQLYLASIMNVCQNLKTASAHLGVGRAS